jgi:hypothetical protein
VSAILPSAFVDGPDTLADGPDIDPTPLIRGDPPATNVDPVVTTGTTSAPTNTRNTPPPRESPPKEPQPKPGTVHTERKVYRPKLPSLYVEPDLGPDLLDGMELIHKEFGRSIRQAVDPLPPRTDAITFDPSVHQAEFDRNVR